MSIYALYVHAIHVHLRMHVICTLPNHVLLHVGATCTSDTVLYNWPTKTIGKEQKSPKNKRGVDKCVEKDSKKSFKGVQIIFLDNFSG